MQYLCVRLLNDSQHLPETKSYGYVDIRPAKLDCSDERDAIQKSIAAFDNKVSIEKPNRMVTIVEADCDKDAYDLSNSSFVEVMDLFELHSMYTSKDDLLLCGFIRKLDSLKIVPITPDFLGINIFPYLTIYMARPDYSVIEPYQYIAHLNNEAALAFKHSAHWARLAKVEANQYMKLLFYWIALESLCYVDRKRLCKADRKYKIDDKICLVLGFPLDYFSDLMDISVIHKLKLIDDYLYWRDCIHNDVKTIRDLRNKMVHSGFRTLYVNSDLKRYITILHLSYYRMIAYFQTALYDNQKDVKTIWSKMHEYVQNNMDLIKDIEGNVICTLKNRIYV